MHYDCEHFVAALANRIKELRTQRGWTQMQMVQDFGYYLSHWQNIESGRKMSLETMLRVANTFDVDLTELLTGTKRCKGIGFGCKGHHLQVTKSQKGKT